jgi:hypothetical protein
MKDRDHSRSMKDCQISGEGLVDRLRRALIPVGVFAVAALVGPLVRYVAWPPSKISGFSIFRLDVFVYDLVFLLWPTQMLALVEASVGSRMAVGIAVAANVLLYGAVGMLVGVTAHRQIAVRSIYLVGSALVALLALWGAGFALAYLNVPALGLALIIYAIPFWVVEKWYRKPFRG